MSQIYYFRDGSGNIEIPLADNSFYTDAMDANYHNGECFIEFTDGSGNVVTPDGTACTIEFRSAGIDGQYLEASGAPAPISSDDVQAGNSDYTPPSFNSIAIKSKVTLANTAGVTTATHFRAYHWRY